MSAYRYLLIFMLATIFPAPAVAKISVVITIPPLYLLAHAVTGDSASIEMLLAAELGPHDFALSPRELKKLAKADAVIFNGLGLEPWLGKITESMGNKRPATIEASAGINPIQSNKSSVSVNPHVWLDPVLAMKQVENIRDGLSAIDPENAPSYRANAAECIRTLNQLHNEIAGSVAGISRRKIVTLHDAFGYFARRYGFEVVAVVQPNAGREPTPQQLRQLREIIKRENLRVIFTEPRASSKILDSLVSELHLNVAMLDTMESGTPSRRSYVEVMRGNLSSLVKALNE
jgi:zinc transport system substrate-binding protein